MSLYFDITNVLWDLEDFPVPGDRCVESFRDNITGALRDLGYCGRLCNMFGFPSYDKLSTEVGGHFLGAEVRLCVNRKTKFDRLMRILTHMLSFARARAHDPVDHPYEKCNLVVIAKDDAPDDGDQEFVTALSALITLGCNVFLAVPDDLPLAEMPTPTIASRVWYWSDLFDGKSPIRRIGVEEPVGPRQVMVKQTQELLLSDGGDTCDLSDLDDDGFPIKREKRMPDEDDDGFPNKRDKRMPDEEEEEGDDDEQQLMLVIEEEGIL